MLMSWMKKRMKDIIGQMIDEFEEGMKELIDDARKYFNNTVKAFVHLQENMLKENSSKQSLPKEAKSSAPLSSGSKSSKPSANISAPKNTKSKDTVSSSHSPAWSAPSPSTQTAAYPPRTAHYRQKKSKFLKKPKVLYVGNSVAHNVDF